MPVYFIQAGADGPVKIGQSADVAGRFVELQVGHYELLTLLRVVEGGRPTEAWFQLRFARLRVRGEWFRFDPAMLVVEPPGDGGMQTFKDIIQRWKTAEDLARELGEKGVTVRQWGNRNSIPPEKWIALVNAAGRAGFEDVTLELLASMAGAGGDLAKARAA